MREIAILSILLSFNSLANSTILSDLNEAGLKKTITAIDQANKQMKASQDPHQKEEAAAKMDNGFAKVNEICDSDPKNPNLKKDAAQGLSEIGFPDRALPYVNQAVQLSPQDPNIRATRANIRYQLHDYKGAAEDAQQALETDPENASARTIYRFATEQLARGHGTAPQFMTPPQQQRFANQEQPQGRPQPPMRARQEAQDPSMLFAPFLSGPQHTAMRALAPRIFNAIGTGHFQDALALTVQAKQAEPDNPLAYFQSAIVRSHMRDNDGVGRDADSAIRLGLPPPLAAEMRVLQARAFVDDGKFMAARDSATDALKLNPDSANAHYIRAKMGEQLKAPVSEFMEDYSLAAQLATRSDKDEYEKEYEDAFQRYGGAAAGLGAQFGAALTVPTPGGPDRCMGSLPPECNKASPAVCKDNVWRCSDGTLYAVGAPGEPPRLLPPNPSFGHPASGGGPPAPLVLLAGLLALSGAGYLLLRIGRALGARSATVAAAAPAGAALGAAANGRGATPLPDVSVGEAIHLDHSTIEIGRMIGQGGMGTVYEGEDKGLGRKVAVKELRSELQVDARARERFLQEARMVAQLSHPNIVTIHSVINTPKRTLLVFEYVEGRTLADVLHNSPNRRLSVRQALDIARQMCAALEFAHSKHVIHRDLKPSNVMIEDSGRVKVMDFGIARQAKDSMMAMTNTIMGTPYYMAPEMEDGAIGKESDLYMLGVCFYEMLVGDVPFAGPGCMSLKRKGEFRLPSKIDPSFSPKLDAFFQRALSPKPQARPKDAVDFLNQLFAAALA